MEIFLADSCYAGTSFGFVDNNSGKRHLYTFLPFNEIRHVDMQIPGPHGPVCCTRILKDRIEAVRNEDGSQVESEVVSSSKPIFQYLLKSPDVDSSEPSFVGLALVNVTRTVSATNISMTGYGGDGNLISARLCLSHEGANLFSEQDPSVSIYYYQDYEIDLSAMPADEVCNDVKLQIEQPGN